MLKNHIWRQKKLIGGQKLYGNKLVDDLVRDFENRKIDTNGLNSLNKLSKYGEKKSVKRLWFGCKHSKCEKQAKMILDELQTQKPQLIILEGMIAWNNWNLEQKLKYLEQFKNLSLVDCLEMTGVREKGAVYFYLCQNLDKLGNGEIEIICGEGDLEMELSELTKEYNPSDILEMYLIREICQYFRTIKVKDDFCLESLLVFVIKFVRITGILNFLNLEKTEKLENLCLENNLKIYLANLEQKYKVNLQTFDPRTSRKLEYLMIPQENSQIKIRCIKKTLSSLRDYFLLQKIENSTSNSQKIFILYGLNHIEKVWSNSIKTRKDL